MDKFLVIVFDSELKAYEAAKALEDLQQEGSINLYEKVVIARDASGKLTVKQKGDKGPIGTTVGMLNGSLISTIGGTVGVAVGADSGTVRGLLFDLAHLGVSEDFLYEVERTLQPGNAAVIAEVWEEWTMPVDTRMEALGSVVYRESRKEVVDDQFERDIAALKADLGELEAEYKQSTGEARAKLQKKIDAARGRLQAELDDIQTRIEASQKQTEAKIKSLQEQAVKESGERKAKREARVAELKGDQLRRSDLLKQAWELTKEALSV